MVSASGYGFTPLDLRSEKKEKGQMLKLIHLSGENARPAEVSPQDPLHTSTLESSLPVC